MRRPYGKAVVFAIFTIFTVLLLIILVGPAAHWLASYDKKAQPTPEQVDAARGRLFQVSAALVALGVLWYTARNHMIAQKTHRLALGQYNLAERGQITERFAKAIEQLGSDNIDVRIGAIYILERIARDSSEDHPPVMEILCSFVRRRTGKPGGSTDETDTPVRTPDFDVQAALTVLVRRDPARDQAPVSLVGANLAGAQFEGANLQRADLRFTDLRETHLHGADLQGANFTKANLAGAYLHGANASRANLRWANMEHVWANRTNFRHAFFWGADLRRADLHEADLRNADLSRKETPLVTPPGSEYSMTHLKGPYPDGWTVSSHYFPGINIGQAILLGAQLEGANLKGVEGLTREQLNSAASHTELHLPDYLLETTDEC